MVCRWGKQRPGTLGHHPGHDRLGGGASERRVACEHLVDHRSQGVHVRAGGDLPLAHRLLRAHVLRGAQRHPGFGHPGAARLARRQGDSEVRHQRPAVVQQDVFRLDVPVDDLVAVGVIEGGGHFGRDPHRVGHRELLLPIEPGPEGFSFHEGHHVEEEGVGLARIEEGKNVRVLKVGGELDLGEKALGPDDRGQLRPQQLEGDPAVVPEVMGQIHRGHAAGTDFTLEPVAFGEGRLQPGDELGHFRLDEGLPKDVPDFSIRLERHTQLGLPVLRASEPEIAGRAGTGRVVSVFIRFICG